MAVTREEIYLQAIAGSYSGEIPIPITREEHYLHYLCVNYGLGRLSQEQIDDSVQKYLESNNVSLNISGGTFADWGE